MNTPYTAYDVRVCSPPCAYTCVRACVHIRACCYASVCLHGRSFNVLRQAYVHLLEDCSELHRGQTVLIQSIVPADSLQDLEVTATQIVSTLEHHLKRTTPQTGSYRVSNFYL